MKYAYLIGLLIAGLVLSIEGFAAPNPGALSEVQQESIQAILKNARQFEKDRDNVGAFLMYTQAKELEGYWSGLQADTEASKAADAFLQRALEPESTLLSEILSSTKIDRDQKRYLLRHLDSQLN